MDQKTVDTYNKMALEYDEETVDFWEQFPREFFDKFIALAQGKVLDVGSGPGRDGLILQQQGLAVTCLDAAEAMVRLSAAKGLESIVGDFTQLPFTDHTFDAVWVYTTLLHVPKAEIHQPLQEIQRVLKPQGLLGLGLIEGTTEGYRESAGVNMPRWFSFYTKHEVSDLLEHHGFSTLYFEEFIPGKKKYLNFIARKMA
ncbi:MAG: class I SAM-dependent methyltransferase [Candidatus Andersenbacteria bacterium]